MTAVIILPIVCIVAVVLVSTIPRNTFRQYVRFKYPIYIRYSLVKYLIPVRVNNGE